MHVPVIPYFILSSFINNSGNLSNPL